MWQLIIAMIIAIAIIIIINSLNPMLTSMGIINPPSTTTVVSLSLNDMLYNKGWRLYTSPNCIWCKKQLALLGGSYKGIINTPNPKITSFPTLINGSQINPGYQSIKELHVMAANYVV